DHVTDAAHLTAAREWLRRANVAGPDDAQILFEYYRAFERQGGRPPPPAVAALERALELVPQSFDLRQRFARELVRARRYAFAIITATLTLTPVPALADPVAIEVTTAPAIQGPQSGRILVFAHRVEPGAPVTAEVDSSPFEPTGTAVAGREVQALSAGRPAIVDGETDAFPMPFSHLPPGTYRFQAVLDHTHDYNYGGPGAGDIVSPGAAAP